MSSRYWKKESCENCIAAAMFYIREKLNVQITAVSSPRSGVADYIIFLITLYDIIFQWWLYIHNIDQNSVLNMNFLLNY
jgi:EamA domain-containing membrane protein RarD